MTFYDPNNGCFAGLGHAICDVDTGQLMPLSQGEIVEASIIGVHDVGQSRAATGCLCCQPFHRFSVHKQLQRCLRDG